MGFGIWKLLLLLAVVLVVFGPGKLPNAMKDLGKGFKSLKDELGKDDDVKRQDNGDHTIVVNPEKDSGGSKEA